MAASANLRAYDGRPSFAGMAREPAFQKIEDVMTEIHWAEPVKGRFRNGVNWAGGVKPSAYDDAILDAAGRAFTVTIDADIKPSETVNSIQLAANATLQINGGTFVATKGTGLGANSGHIDVFSANLCIGGAVDNSGAIKFSTARMTIISNTTLSGGGTVSGGAIDAASGVGAVTLTNVDNTISGGGSIDGYGSGFDNLVVVNGAKGVIDSNEKNGDFRFNNSNASGVIVNLGLIEADNFSIMGAYNTDINGDGVILSGTNSTIRMYNCAVAGQTLTTATSGEIAFVQGSSVTTGANLQNAGAIYVEDGSLTFDANVTLSGGGTVALQAFETRGVGVITGTQSSVILENVDNTISGYGELGAGSMTLVNDAAGAIVGYGQLGELVIDTGYETIINAGLIEGGGVSGNLIIESPIDNNGVIETGGSFAPTVVEKAVTGSGQAKVEAGTLDFESSFNQNVTFSSGAYGVLELAHSQAYTAAISGFSPDGAAKLDLRDVGFVSAGEASFSGTTQSGILTVSDGTHTARIALIGNYTGSTFVASSDGAGGVTVVAQAPDAPATPSHHLLIAAIAGLGASSAEASPSHAGEARMSRSTLAVPVA